MERIDTTMAKTRQSADTKLQTKTAWLPSGVELEYVE
jgi:hypothetical protein